MTPRKESCDRRGGKALVGSKGLVTEFDGHGLVPPLGTMLT